ncbi:hypothetical protein [Helicobacter sp. MIT 01-3238]|uniref:hypothetical protein n=1 Tax=Helicobacter sp. MIT 01-3238 TaxID=398627 RepID=UPI0011C05412|nr:hypothetical protein [Helicobacter sp. MIT 01-3238]
MPYNTLSCHTEGEARSIQKSHRFPPCHLTLLYFLSYLSVSEVSQKQKRDSLVASLLKDNKKVR